jgi:predicted nucleic acid-binding protein
MTLVVDAGPLVALGDAGDPRRSDVEAALRLEPGALIVPAPVTAEADHVLGKRLGRRARLALLDDLAEGRFAVECLGPKDHQTILELERKYEELDCGLSDLSIVILAARFETTRVMTFDERHFRALRPLQGETFTLLPADQEV